MYLLSIGILRSYFDSRLQVSSAATAKNTIATSYAIDCMLVLLNIFRFRERQVQAKKAAQSLPRPQVRQSCILEVSSEIRVSRRGRVVKDKSAEV